MKNIYIIGAGGVGSWLAPAICLLSEPGRVTLIDGDTLEAKNLNRQLFTTDDIGSNKAAALGARYHCNHIDQYYANGLVEADRTDWLLVCADNNPARYSALETCDATGCRAIVGANEVTSAEAYFYNPKFKDGPMDPRTYYPEIATDSRFDPRRASIGCTGEAQGANRQLVSANFMAAGLMQHLFVLWEMETRTLKRDALPFLPYLIRQNLTKYETRREFDLPPITQEVQHAN